VSRKRPHLISGTAPIGKKNAELETLVAAPAGQKSPPAAGLGLGRADLLREFVRRAVVVDPGIVGRPDERNDRRNGGWNSLRNVLP
jgi:hypothetical protein